MGCVCVCVRAPLVCSHSWLGCAVCVCVLGLWSRLRPATPGWGVGAFLCLCARSASTPPLLAGLCSLGVCALAPASAAPRHSWLGCWGVRVFVCALRLYPATPCWGALCGCVCLGARPLLAGVLGCVCACVPAQVVPRLSWLGCAVWACVFGLGFWLCPATPGWGVEVCVWLCARSACTLPLLAGVHGVGVCACARVSAPPRHIWLGCRGVRVCVCAPLVPRHSWLGCGVWVCVLGLGFRLDPATPGWGVWMCVCSCARSACTPPLLAGVWSAVVRVWARVLAAPCHSWLGYWGVRVCVRTLLVPRHSWLGRAVLVCVPGLGFWLQPATLCLGVQVCVCSCARSACTLQPWLGCVACVCVLGHWVGLRPATLGLGVPVCVFVCTIRLYPATPGWGVRCWCVCLGTGFGCAPPLLAGVLGCACFCARSGGTPPLLAGVCDVGVCAWARVLAAPRHSWLRCWAVCGFLWPLRMYPATPGWGVWRGCVCLGAGFGCAPPLLAGVLGRVCLCLRSACTPPLLAGVCGVGVCVWAGVWAAPRHSCLECWGVRVCVCSPLVPRHFWPGCVVWVCVLELGFRLRPATPGCGAGVCVCLCARSACTPPLLARVCGVGVCVWAGVSAAPRHSCLEYWGVCVCVRAQLVRRQSPPGCAVLVCVLGHGFRLRPATPGWGVGCACFCARSGCCPPLLAGTVRRGSVCLGAGFGCALPLLAGVFGCVCVRVPAPHVPRHSWLRCAAWVCVLARRVRLRPATLGWGVGMCVFVCALRLYPATPDWVVRCGCVCLGRGFGFALPLLPGVLGCACLCVLSACTLPLPARVCGVGVCAWAWVSAAPRHSWLLCWGVCVLVCALRLYPATPGWAVRCGCVC